MGFLFSSVFLGNTEGVKDLTKKDRSITNAFVAKKKALKRVAKKFPFSDHRFFLSSSFLRRELVVSIVIGPSKGAKTSHSAF